jgi:hypothetical protein
LSVSIEGVALKLAIGLAGKLPSRRAIFWGKPFGFPHLYSEAKKLKIELVKRLSRLIIRHFGLQSIALIFHARYLAEGSVPATASVA